MLQAIFQFVYRAFINNSVELFQCTHVCNVLTCFVNIDLSKSNHSLPKYIFVKKPSPNALLNFRNDLIAADLPSQLINDISVDPNLNYNVIHQVFQSGIKKYYPTKKLKI